MVKKKNIKNAKKNNGEEALDRSQFDKDIANAVPVSIVTIDKDGSIISVNKYFKKISVEKFPLHKNIFKMPFFIKEGLCPGYKKLLKKGAPLRKENCISMDGLKYMNITAIPTKDKNGNINGAISMAVDVTETVNAKLELDKLNNELEKKIAEKTRQLEHSMKLKSQFISDASHELRTPLAIAKLNLELYKKQFPKENKASVEVLTAIDYEINKVADILSDIAFFTAIDEESMKKVKAEGINLNRFIENLAGRIKSLADMKNISISFKKDRSDPVIWGDKIKLEKLFLNIIGNSIKYGRKFGWIKIRIETDPKNKAVKIAISDNGIGIAKKDVPLIFDRFYRTDASRDGGEGGFGLGLAICKWIVEQHKGSIGVKSLIDKGSVFTVALPVRVE